MRILQMRLCLTAAGAKISFIKGRVVNLHSFLSQEISHHPKQLRRLPDTRGENEQL